MSSCCTLINHVIKLLNKIKLRDRSARNSPHGLVKVRQSVLKTIFGFQGVPDVVVEFGVQLVHFQAGREYRVLGRPVQISRVRFHRVSDDEGDYGRPNDSRLAAKRKEHSQLRKTLSKRYRAILPFVQHEPQAVGDQHAEPHRRHVQHSFGDDEPDGKEHVGRGQER